MKKLVQIICVALLSASAHAAPLTEPPVPLTVVAAAGFYWPDTIGEEIATRQRGAGMILTVDVDRTTNVLRETWASNFAAASSIHFIGLGRGASMLATLAGQFPDVRIDQFTTIDPAPINVPANVLFADNYFQTDGPVKGAELAGAYNAQMTARGLDPSASVIYWYYLTIRDKDGAGYPFADCPYGARPLEGFRSRRIGQPTQLLNYDPKTKTIQPIFGGGFSGKYYLDGTHDFKTWQLGTDTDAFLFDGRPSRSGPISLQNVPPGAQLFFRLRSVEASF